MRVLLILLLLLLAAVMGGAAFAWSRWGGWGLLGAFATVVVLGFVGKKLAGVLLRKLFEAPFRMKGQPLRGATLVVHGIEAATPPARDWSEAAEFEDDADDGDFAEEMAEERRTTEAADARRRWYRLDVTITPPAPTGQGFTHWEPGELAIVPAGSDPRRTMDDEEEAAGEVYDVAIWDPSQDGFGPDEGMKYPGPQRIRLHVGVEPNCDRLALRYYFEQFGRIDLPKS